MLTEQERIEVEIGGQVFTLICEEGVEHVLQVTALVERRLQELHKAAPYAKYAPPERIALMVAMSLADELIRTSKGHS